MGSFNWKKAQLQATIGDPFGAEIAPEGIDQEGQYADEPMQEGVYATEDQLESDLIAWGSQQDAWDNLSILVLEDSETVTPEGQAIDAREQLQRGLTEYYETDPAAEHTKEEAVHMIFDVLPHPEEGEREEDIQAPYTAFAENKMYDKYIKISNDHIQKLASDFVNKSKTDQKAFNLIKSAQAKTIENTFLWGPHEKRFDPFLRQPVSDWHVVERNKGFGLTVDDVYNIDWENIWRGTVMDKYSRPYRDKDGNWVGGYLNKRFETDKWIPPTNNYQLKPGERRRARPPEYGVTEARLQDMRSKDDRGYGPETDTSKPFNWREASKKNSLEKQAVVNEDEIVDSDLKKKLS